MLKLGGIKLKFHWLFLLIIFILAVYGYMQEIVLLFGLVLAHEFVHLLVARLHGLEVGSIELFPFGGVASIEDVLEMDPYVERNVALAGPLFNFFLVLLAIVVYANFPAMRQQELFLFFIRSNLVLGFFNLLPALPLDGGRILRARLATFLGFRQATELAVRISQAISLVLFLVGLVFFYYGYFHITIFAASLFLYFASSKERTIAVYTVLRGLGKKKKIFHEQGVLPLVTLMTLEDTELKEVLRRFATKKYHRILVVNKAGEVQGEAMENEVLDKIMSKGLHAPARSILRKNR